VARGAQTFRLRSYRDGDFEALYKIDQLCYEPEIAYSRRELRGYLGFSGSDCVVAESTAQPPAQRGGNSKLAAKIVGFCIIAADAGYGYIITIDVLEPWRRHRVGHRLLLLCERRARRRGAQEIGLDTATDNAAAIAFWRKHGYREIGVRRLYYPNGSDAFAMRKSIT
jgi:ribosomal-protein-alanine N-acetyltransferase